MPRKLGRLFAAAPFFLGAAAGRLSAPAFAPASQTTPPPPPRLSAAAAAAETVTITVQPGARQTFAGFGASLGNWGGEYQTLAPAERARLSRSVWRDLKFKSLRLWMNTDQFAPTPGAHDLSQFRRCYVDSGLIADAKKNGVTDLLLAPDAVPSYLQEARPNGAGRALRAGAENAYADLVADFIERLRNETGVLVNFTGVQNEPNDIERFSPAQIVLVVKRLRSELDRRGLRSVRIIAPESANVDGVFYETLDLLRADKTAWNALAGVASHAYAMAATPEAARRVAGSGKSYWMTEASENGPESPGDTRRAASLATRFLSEMNQRVTHWVHFIGFEVADPNDNATRILAYTPKPFTVTTFQKWFYYHQLTNTFDVGAAFRQATSTRDSDMVWTYGKKPRVTVAAARNPDGSWGVGVANYSSPQFSDATKNERGEVDQNGYAAKTFTVTVRVPELARAGNIAFRARRSGPNVNEADAGTIVLRGGEMSVSVAPLELVTLRSTRAGNNKQ